MAAVLVTGANRGIGLEFTRQFSGDGWDVIATARESSAELDALEVRVEQLDMRDLDGVTAFADRIDAPLALMIANAATNHPMNADSAQDAKAWVDMMAVNAIAPFMLAKSLLPRLAEAE